MLSGENARTAAFEAVCAAVTGGPGGSLFGSRCGPASDAFRKSLFGAGQPGFWLEAPLNGEPFLDLHVAYGREQLRTGDQFADGDGFGRQELFDWYIREKPGGNGLALDHDLGSGCTGLPGVAVNVNGAPLTDPGAFFEAAGEPQLAEPVRRLLGGLPDGWMPWYFGQMPNRPGNPGRVDCFLADRWREQCAEDPCAFSEAMERIGAAAPDAGMRACLQELARIPLGWEIQTDVLEDGRIVPSLTLSLMLPVRGRTSARKLFSEDGPAAEAMGMLERLGAADGRWRLIPEAVLARLAPVPVPGGDPAAVLMAALPRFVKIRWDHGALRTAKVYFACRADLPGSSGEGKP